MIQRETKNRSKLSQVIFFSLEWLNSQLTLISSIETTNSITYIFDVDNCSVCCSYEQIFSNCFVFSSPCLKLRWFEIPAHVSHVIHLLLVPCQVLTAKKTDKAMCTVYIFMWVCLDASQRRNVLMHQMMSWRSFTVNFPKTAR